MGKLHTLRRAIEREPENWYYLFRHIELSSRHNRDMQYKWKYPHGAVFENGQWEPRPYHRNYRYFVTKVLKDIGYIDFVS